MNTIEMLKELVENGGMFVNEDKFNSYIVSFDTAFGVCIVTPDQAFLRNISMYAEFMEATWKPYVKPVDWSKVPIDTKVLCLSRPGVWQNRHFAGIYNETPSTWLDGTTSWSGDSKSIFNDWVEMKLADATE